MYRIPTLIGRRLSLKVPTIVIPFRILNVSKLASLKFGRTIVDAVIATIHGATGNIGSLVCKLARQDRFHTRLFI